jgi:hypothetical protein
MKKGISVQDFLADFIAKYVDENNEDTAKKMSD